MRKNIFANIDLLIHIVGALCFCPFIFFLILGVFSVVFTFVQYLSSVLLVILGICIIGIHSA